jgi:hypothetical protein
MDKVKVLFLAANPSGTPRLTIDEEIRGITAKVRASEYRDALELISRWAVRPDDLLQSLLEVRPHIVHFSGHGSRTEEIILQDQDGQPKRVSKEALVHVFHTLRDNVRVVVLNACSTRSQADALAKTIDCVIGMNQPIGDEAAFVFAASFYRAVGFGRSVKEAFDLGRAALLLEGIPEAQTPELLTHSGVDAAGVVLLPSPSAAVLSAKSPTAKKSLGVQLEAPDRLTFVRTLSAMSPPDWATLVAMIPRAAMYISHHGTIPEQVAELVRWAESSTGPGLEFIRKAADAIFPPILPNIESAPTTTTRSSGAKLFRNKVVISYAHEDRTHLDRLQVHLKPLERQGIVDRWDDTRITTSQKWREEIRTALESAKVAVLLISADFLASDFIANDELPSLLAAAETEGTVIMPVIVSPCRFAATPTLSQFQAVNPNLQPLLSMRRSKREELWVKLTNDIQAALSS